MLSQIVGPVDQYSASVLVFAFITLCIVITTMVVKRRSRRDISNEHELAKIKQADESARSQYVAETTRMVEFKKIDQGLITSHRREE